MTPANPDPHLLRLRLHEDHKDRPSRKIGLNTFLCQIVERSSHADTEAIEWTPLHNILLAWTPAGSVASTSDGCRTRAVRANDIGTVRLDLQRLVSILTFPLIGAVEVAVGRGSYSSASPVSGARM
jgi:hypothetical protein